MADDGKLMALVRAHPVITTIMTLCTLGGILGAFCLAPESWSGARTLMAGLCAGAFVGLCVVAPKMFT